MLPAVVPVDNLRSICGYMQKACPSPQTPHPSRTPTLPLSLSPNSCRFVKDGDKSVREIDATSCWRHYVQQAALQLEVSRVVRRRPPPAPAHAEALSERAKPIPEGRRNRVAVHSEHVDVECSTLQVQGVEVVASAGSNEPALLADSTHASSDNERHPIRSSLVE